MGDRGDRSVNEDDVNVLREKFGRLLRNKDFTLIKAYAGVRPIPEGDDFIITYSGSSRHVIHLIGIESPGLTSAPAIAGGLWRCSGRQVRCSRPRMVLRRSIQW